MGFLAMILMFRMGVQREEFTYQMPRHPDYQTGRTIPLVAEGNAVVYVSPTEKRTWDIVHYEGWGSLGAFVTSGSLRELWDARRRKLKRPSNPPDDLG
jgi:hypothetical protein